MEIRDRKEDDETTQIQRKVYSFLQRNDGEATTSEIASFLGVKERKVLSELQEYDKVTLKDGKWRLPPSEVPGSH